MKKIFKLNYTRLMQGLSLFLLSVILTAFFTALSFVIIPIAYLITIRWQSGLNAIGDYFYRLAISVDQFGNGSCAKMLDLCLIKKDGIKFGEIDDTISYVIARNKYKGTLTIVGRFFGWLLNKLDKEHLEKSINEKIESDQEALLRVQENKYWR